jgi:hypothetical protein
MLEQGLVKVCAVCGGTKRYKSGGCVACQKQRNLKNNDYKRHREWKLLNKYGISVEAWNSMMRKQDFKCAICKTDFDVTDTKHIHTDHDHDSGTVRGILCQGCNLGLGGFRDDPARLEAAAEYIRVSKGVA